MKNTKNIQLITSLVILSSTFITVTSLIKGRQEQFDYLCKGNDKYTELPWDCTGYITCSTDNYLWYAHWMDCPPPQLWSQSMKTCSYNPVDCHDPKDIKRTVCEKYPTVTFAHPDSCAKYFDCTQIIPKYGLRQYENECPYAQLYDSREERCKDGHLVYCGKRVMPMGIGGYVLENGPCKNRPNGAIPIPNQPFSDNFLMCKNGATSSMRCYMPGQVFDPIAGKCTANYKTNLANYCTNNPGARFPVSNHCGKFYDCRQASHNAQLELYQNECPYLQLFDSYTATCKPYDQVECVNRFEPKSPSDYTVCHCTGTPCLQCEVPNADCKFLPDGMHDLPATTNTGDYLECKDGRTAAVKTCPDGYAFSGNSCTDRFGKTIDYNPVQSGDYTPLMDVGDKGQEVYWGQDGKFVDKEIGIFGRSGLVGFVDFGSPSSDPNANTDPTANDPNANTDPTANDPNANTGPTVNDPNANTGPTVNDPNANTGPTVNDPNANTDPNANPDPNVNDPNVNDPNANPDPNVNDPNVNDPNVNDPTINDPNVNDPTINDPNVNDPNVNDPNANSDQNVNDPNVNDPNVNDPNVNDPNANTDPNGNDPNANPDPNTAANGETTDPGINEQCSIICPAVAPAEPVISYRCDCASELGEVAAQLARFETEQRAINDLASLECKNPPTVLRARTTLYHNVMGAEATYECEHGYSFCGSRAASTCPGNGVWEPVDGVCVQSVWNYPRVMFSEKFLCPFTAGTHITIYGTPTRYKKAMIQLDSGTDSALVITICFQCGSTFEQVSFNAVQGGVSVEPVAWDKFPFAVGKEFKVDISVTQNAYKIVINDSPPFYYNHVLPVPQVESVAIIDEITIRKVIIEPSNSLQTIMPAVSDGVVPAKSIDVGDTTTFTFNVKACEDVKFHLTTADTDDSPAYIVSLGASGNNVSTIAKCDTCPSIIDQWHQPLSCSQFRSFWVTWLEGLIKVGSGYIPDKNTFLEVTDTDIPINYFRVKQGETEATEWILTTPIQKCGVPPPMADSRVEIQEVGAEAEAVYTCNDIYTFCGESHVSKCSAQGTWEGYKGECLQSTWRMLRMPASLRFPCSFSLGSVLSLHGMPTNSFTVSLNSGSDTLIEMEVNPVSNTITYNSNIDQTRGAEISEVSTKQHFNMLKDFHLTLTVEQAGFTVKVDGVTIYQFAHRAPYESLNAASIKNRVFVKKVQVFPSETPSSDCQQPAAVEYGDVSTLDTTVGSEVNVKCDVDHFFCGASPLMVCGSNGNWMGLDGSCAKGTWRDQGVVPVEGAEQKFPCRYQPGLKVSIKGVPLKEEATEPFFKIEIQAKTEILLRLEFYKTEIKMNSLLPNLGVEEMAEIPPLEANTPVQVDVMMNDREFLVYLGNTLKHRFTHRAPAARAYAVYMFPSIDVKEVKFSVVTA